MIVLEPSAGLCNRMYSIASAYHLAKETNHTLLLLWDVDHSLGAKVQTLFHLPNDIRIIHTTELSIKKAPFRRIKSILCKSKYKKMAASELTPNDIRELKDTSDGLRSLTELARRSSNLYIRAYQNFLPHTTDQSQYFRIFTPSDAVMKKTAPILAQFSKNTIGIHIRRTDHEDAIVHSPLDAFLARMDSYLQNDLSISFFLATDDKDTENHLLARYSGKIIINPNKHFSRKSSNGIIDAYVDLLCLSNCSMILGSYKSTFSEVASKLQNIPLEIIQIS